MKGYFISGAQKLKLDNVYTHCSTVVSLYSALQSSKFHSEHFVVESGLWEVDRIQNFDL